MALSKKKSRPISVGNHDFRWQFFENSGWNDVTVQAANGLGPKLTVQIPWSHQGMPNVPFDPPVTPLLVRTIIEAALAQGWHPESTGKTQNFRWTENTLVPS